MILSLTAAAGHHFPGVVVADTSVIPTAKTSITNKPLAGKTAAKSPEAGTAKSSGKPVNTVKVAKPVTTGSMVKKNTATEKVGSNTNKNRTEPATKSTVKKTTASKNSTVTKNSTATKNNAATKTGTTSENGSSVKSVTTTKSTTTTSTKKTPLAGKKLAALTPTETNKPTKNSKTKSRKLRKGIGIELYPPLAFKYAILLDVPVEKVTDEKLLEVLDHWYGTRYRYGGETRRGIDCSAFTQAFMRSYFDYELPRTSEEQFTTCKHIKKRKLRQGDLVFFKTSGAKGGITHVGVYLVNNRFVHSATSTGVRISDLNDDYYKEKYAGAGRIR